MNLKLARKFAVLAVLLACLFVSTSARAEYSQEECDGVWRQYELCEDMCNVMCGGSAYNYMYDYGCYTCWSDCYYQWSDGYEQYCVQ